MTSALSLKFPACEPITIHLLDDDAPNTVKWALDAFSRPISAEVWHAIYSGPEIEIRLDDLPERVRGFAGPGENQAVAPEAGDVMLVQAPPHTVRNQKQRVLRIGLFYAAGATTFGPVGWTAVSIFGKVDPAHLAFLARQSQEIRRTGIKTVTLTRASL